MESDRRASESAMKRDVVEARADVQCHAALPERVVGDARWCPYRGLPGEERRHDCA